MARWEGTQNTSTSSSTVCVNSSAIKSQRSWLSAEGETIAHLPERRLRIPVTTNWESHQIATRTRKCKHHWRAARIPHSSARAALCTRPGTQPCPVISPDVAFTTAHPANVVKGTADWKQDPSVKRCWTPSCGSERNKPVVSGRSTKYFFRENTKGLRGGSKWCRTHLGISSRSAGSSGKDSRRAANRGQSNQCLCVSGTPQSEQSPVFVTSYLECCFCVRKAPVWRAIVLFRSAVVICSLSKKVKAASRPWRSSMVFRCTTCCAIHWSQPSTNRQSKAELAMSSRLWRHPSWSWKKGASSMAQPIIENNETNL